ncbi:hypothetical protein [Methylococcus sp. EFPC2]|uniref:hypothetical protein n=1 Tax=Methylococcus sp. EFPC2 TaxID=2812648 RepID=UPI0019678A3C|nr:hypothetical protein [Methylococcus sp. EFPC2]QSA97857.1 hypothetical protein JWZ97_03245 [Methylococcus sp. EFPC2]
MKVLRQSICSGAGIRGEQASSYGTRLLLSLLLCGVLAGCGLVKNTFELPDKAIASILPRTQDGKAVDPVELQARLLRFADNYLDDVRTATGQLHRDGEGLDPMELQTLRLTHTGDVLEVATGQNTFANLLDMVVLIDLVRMTVEDIWVPKEYGASALPLLQVSRAAEAEIWKIASGALRPEQLAELRDAIATWHREHPDIKALRTVRPLGFAAEVAKANRPKEGMFVSVFNLLNVDPLAGLDPATRELAETRLLGERALFLAQRMPRLIRWETEVLTLSTAKLPEIQQWLGTTSQLAVAGDRISRVAERLPSVIGKEREEILRVLQSEVLGLTVLSTEARQAMATGTQMADAASGTLKNFQDVLEKFASGPREPGSEPFRIREYTEAAAEIGATAQQLGRLLDSLTQSLESDRIAQLDALARKTQENARALVDYVFWKAVLLVLLSCGAILATALLYRTVAARFRANGAPDNQAGG